MQIVSNELMKEMCSSDSLLFIWMAKIHSREWSSEPSPSEDPEMMYFSSWIDSVDQYLDLWVMMNQKNGHIALNSREIQYVNMNRKWWRKKFKKKTKKIILFLFFIIICFSNYYYFEFPVIFHIGFAQNNLVSSIKISFRCVVNAFRGKSMRIRAIR